MAPRLDDVRSLDHGLFEIPKPTRAQAIGYAISVCMIVFSLLAFITSLGIPDIPRLDEAQRVDSLDTSLDTYAFEAVQSGYNIEEYASEAAFIILPLQLEQGIIGTDRCKWVERDEGGSWEYSSFMADASPLVMVDRNDVEISTAFSLTGSLYPEGDFINPGCNSDWSRTIEGYGEDHPDNHWFTAFVLVEENPVRYQLLSVTETSHPDVSGLLPEVTQREDRGRIGLAVAGLGGLMFMRCCEPSLRHDLRRLREQNRTKAKNETSAPGILGYGGRLFHHFGVRFQRLEAPDHPSRSVEEDWLFGAPTLPQETTNPYAGNEDGQLMPEHPTRLGTPRSATITPYSIGAFIFATCLIWLAADLRARDGSFFHTSLGWALTGGVTVVNLVWFARAWKQFKQIRHIEDLPTSPVRSAALGEVELVGQVRPSIAGTPELQVGGRVQRGLVWWEWKRYRYECTRDSDGDEQCSWVLKESKSGGVPFMLHDGSGGMMIDPSMWEKNGTVTLGPTLDTWQNGDLRWDLTALGVGDPVYILGECISRTQEHREQWGTDSNLGQSLVTVVPSTTSSAKSVVHYGTELDLIADHRSVFEILVVPVFVFLFGIFMFINYTP